MASQTSGTFAGASARYLALASTSQHRETLNRAVLPHGMARTSTRRRASRDRGILERLDEGAVLGDGGYLLELEKRGYVQAGPFTPEVVLEHPAAVKELHQEFLDAGAEVLQSVAFYASKEKLATTGFADRVGRSTAPRCVSRGRSRGPGPSSRRTSASPGCTTPRTKLRPTRSAVCSTSSWPPSYGSRRTS